MHICDRCGSDRAIWFTPERFGRQGGIFQCRDCQKLNIRLPMQLPRLEPVPIAPYVERRRGA